MARLGQSSSSAASSGGSSSGASSGQVPAQSMGRSSASGSMGGGRPILTPQYLLAHRVGIPNTRDVIWEPMYDFQNYPDTGPTGNYLSFFSQQQGQGTTSAPGANDASAKTSFDTNLQVGNQLLLGNEFYAIGSETLWYPGVTAGGGTGVTYADNFQVPLMNAPATAGGQFADDVWALGNQGFKSLKVGTDRYYIQDGPLSLFPPCTRMYTMGAVAGTDSTDVISFAYAAWAGEPYTIVPIYFQTNQLFTLTIVFAGPVTLPSAKNGRIGERLRGYRVRQAT